MGSRSGVGGRALKKGRGGHGCYEGGNERKKEGRITLTREGGGNTEKEGRRGGINNTQEI